MISEGTEVLGTPDAPVSAAAPETVEEAPSVISETRRLAVIDGMRGLAIVLVVWYHTWLVSWLNPVVEVFGLKLDFNAFPQAGFTGVFLFFFISGFCLFLPYAQTLFDGRPKQTVRQFAYRRMLKILPSYYVGLVAWIVLGLGHFGSSEEATWQIFTHAFFINNLWSQTYGAINGVLWSLADEVQFYVLFPAICWAAMRKPALTFAGALVVGIAYRFAVPHGLDPSTAMERLPGVIDTFVAGMFAAWAYRWIAVRRPELGARSGMWTIVGIGGVLLAAGAIQTIYGHRNDPDWSFGWNAYGVPLLELALIPATIGSLLAFRAWQLVLGNPLLLFFSYVSYNYYLWHQIVIDGLGNAHALGFIPLSWQDTADQRLAFSAFTTAVGLAVALVPTLLVERPLLRARPFRRYFGFPRAEAIVRAPAPPPPVATSHATPADDASLRRLAAIARSRTVSEVVTFVRPHAEVLAVVVTAFLVGLFSSHFRSTEFNNYTRLADAMRHGHMWIDYPGPYMDAIFYRGQHYVVDGPFPALLMMPLVLLYGAQANQTTVALLVAAVTMWLAHRLLVRMHVARTPRLFLLLFLFAGTDMWWCAELGDVWFMAHLCAMMAVFAAFNELAGKRRGWVIGLCAIAAFFSRNVELFAIGFFAYALYTGDFARAAILDRGEPPPAPIDVRRTFLSLGSWLSAGVLLWIGYNEASWGTLVDIGHTVYFHADTWGQKEGSPFRLIYVPYQIYSYFMRAPEFEQWLQQAQYPVLKVDTNGVALTFTSPALILAFLARRPGRLVTALWLTTFAVAAPDFLYYLNGWYQFGMRHALDFMPYLFVLMALAVRDRMPRYGMILCVYSAIAGAWGVWWWGTFMRTGD